MAHCVEEKTLLDPYDWEQDISFDLVNALTELGKSRTIGSAYFWSLRIIALEVHLIFSVWIDIVKHFIEWQVAIADRVIRRDPKSPKSIHDLMVAKMETDWYNYEGCFDDLKTR